MSICNENTKYGKLKFTKSSLWQLLVLYIIQTLAISIKQYFKEDSGGLTGDIRCPGGPVWLMLGVVLVVEVGIFDCGSLVLVGSLPINLCHVVLILNHSSQLRLLQYICIM